VTDNSSFSFNNSLSDDKDEHIMASGELNKLPFLSNPARSFALQLILEEGMSPNHSEPHISYSEISMLRVGV
jgi:hypothetical protein